MINWSNIETVLLDMDGTLLDLSFDNYFWLTVVPDSFAKKENMPIDEAIDYLTPILKEQEGLLNWYCLDYWSEKLGMNIAQLKVDNQQHIKELPNTRDFLEAVQITGKRCVLVTNAHADSLILKMQKTGLVEFFDAIVSAHDLGHPKEQQDFWRELYKLEKFDKSTTVMVDDSLSVLKAADTFGIKYLVAISQPDSTEPPRLVHDYTAVEDLSKIKPV
jgi:HAD superfamily hydrolase (TIGR01509 family)